MYFTFSSLVPDSSSNKTFNVDTSTLSLNWKWKGCLLVTACLAIASLAFFMVSRTFSVDFVWFELKRLLMNLRMLPLLWKVFVRAVHVSRETRNSICCIHCRVICNFKMYNRFVQVLPILIDICLNHFTNFTVKRFGVTMGLEVICWRWSQLCLQYLKLIFIKRFCEDTVPVQYYDWWEAMMLRSGLREQFSYLWGI